MTPVVINIHNLVENIAINDSVQGFQELEDSLIETLNKVIQNVQSQVESEPEHLENIDVSEHCVSIKVKDLMALTTELDRLRHHEDTTIGLYAIDRNPKKVSYKWIKKYAFRIKKTYNVL